MATNTVILGAGIIGCSTAYYLSLSPRTQAQNIHLVEANDELFRCASGFAAGFLAADWFAPSVAPLGALSFKLHKELAEKHNGRERWGYSRSTGTSLSEDADVVVGGSGEDWLQNGTSRAAAAGAGEKIPSSSSHPAWLTLADGASIEVISGDESTAQVDPQRLCGFLISQCQERGVQLHHPAKAISVSKDTHDKLASIRIASEDGSETDLPCARLIITAGAWTPKVFSTLFPSSQTRIPIASLAGHSLLLRSPRWSAKDDPSLANGCHAVFATDSLGFSPEIFSRLNGELYIAGLNSTLIPLPSSAKDITPHEDSIRQLKDVARKLLGLPTSSQHHQHQQQTEPKPKAEPKDEDKDDLEVLRASLCFRPVTASGRPVVARVKDEKLGSGWKTYGEGEGGVYVAAGHGAWGIAQSLGTGYVLAEMVEGRQTSVNIKALDLP